MLNSVVPKKKWRISLQRGNGVIVLAAPYMGVKILFTEILEKVYKGKEKIAFSQFMDIDQLDIGNLSEFESKIATQHSIKLSLTASYSEKNAPSPGEKVFVIHGLGSPKFELLNEIFHYGMTNLSNIVYESSENTSDWLPKIIDWNKLFLSWYEFKASDSVIVDLIGQKGLISWTSDYHLSFGVTNIRHLTRVLDTLHEIADKRRLLLIIESKRLARPFER